MVKHVSKFLMLSVGGAGMKTQGQNGEGRVILSTCFYLGQVREAKEGRDST